jgi:hypothetical protein
MGSPGVMVERVWKSNKPSMSAEIFKNGGKKMGGFMHFLANKSPP